MITRHTTAFQSGHDVVPHVRVAAGMATLLELAYEWNGVAGTVPQLSMNLDSDQSLEKVFLAAVYQNGAGERRAIVDSKTVDLSQSVLARTADSADAVLAAQGWSRCFLIFQVFVPPGLMGPVEEGNSVTQVFEYVSRAPNV